MEQKPASFLDARYDGTTDKLDVGVLYKKIENTIALILKSTHKAVEKQRYDMHSDRINFACPYCGDSKRSDRIKRGWVFFTDFNFKCWNGGCRKGFSSFLNMVTDFGHLDSYETSEIMYMQVASQDSIDNPLSLFGGVNKSKSNDINDLTGIDMYAIDRELIMSRLRICEIDERPEIMEYLKSRNQLRRDNRHFGYSKLHDAVAVMNLTADKTKVIGIQLRFMKPNKQTGQRFMTYLYSEMIRKWLGIENANENIVYKMDRICLLYNILSINFQADPCIFEAAFDSHHFFNSMATLSAITKINLPNGLYFYDNSLKDEAGKVEAIKMLKEKRKVFLWAKFIDDYPYFRNCKDLDDIIRTGRPFEVVKLYEYFSNDILDMLYL